MAVGSGAPKVMESIQQPKYSTWYGRCLAVPRPKGNSGRMTLKAEADGLESGTVVVKMQ